MADFFLPTSLTGKRDTQTGPAYSTVQYRVDRLRVSEVVSIDRTA